MWKIVKLGDILELQNGFAFKSKEYTADGYFVMRITNVQQGYISAHNPKYIQIDSSSKLTKFILDQGDILVSLTGDVGRVGVIRAEHLPAALNQRVARVQSVEASVDRDFLFHYLNSAIFRNQVEALGKGAAQANVSTKDVLEITLQLPPLAEQQRIVAKLDAAFAEIDRAVEIEGAKLSSVGALITAKLESMYNDKRFEQKQLKDICKFVGGSQPPKSTFEYEQSDSNIRLIQIRDYKSDKHLTYIPKDKAKRWCSASDVMIGRYGPPIFQILRGIEGAYNVALMKAVPTAELDNDYLFYFLSNRRIQSYVINKSSRAAGQSGVNKDALEPYPIYVPPLEEQRSIIQKTRSLIAQTDTLEKICRDKLEATLSLKSVILAQELQPPQSEAA